MKEITRIHIAKTPYDVEISAKKELELYINQLATFADGQDWIEDIEIRITELLLERNIAKNDLITSEDVTAIKEQLGQPADFTEDSEELTGLDEPTAVSGGEKRLYRDMDDAILGGVLAGAGKFIGVDAIWVRIAFILLLFVSFGTVTIIYLVMWLSIPAAKTSAEKLQLAGEPITLASIKKLREQGAGKVNTNRIAKTTQSIIIYGLGTLSALAAVGSLLITVTAGFLLGATLTDPSSILIRSLPLYTSWDLWTAYTLFIISGLLLTALFSLIAVAFFRKKLSKRVGIALVAITISGVVTFGAGVSAMLYGAYQQNNYIAASEKTEKSELADEFGTITKLTVDSRQTNSHGSPYRVEYQVDEGKPRYEITTNAATADIEPTFTFSEQGKAATLSIDTNQTGSKVNLYSNYPTIRIYGPALEEINGHDTIVTYTNNQSQDKINISSNAGDVILNGTYKNVTAKAAETGNVTLSNATIESLDAGINQGHLNAGVLRNLTITQPEVCPSDSYSRNSSVDIEAVTSGKMTVNGKEMPIQNLDTDCGEIDIAKSEDDDSLDN